MPQEPEQKKDAAKKPAKDNIKPSEKKPEDGANTRPSMRPPLTPEQEELLKKKARKRRLSLGISTAVLVLAATALILFLTGVFSRDSGPGLPELPPGNTGTVNTKAVNPFTGLRELDPAAAGKRGVAFMVNNAPAARPQWGLCSPDVILETMVEGGITRMLFMYADLNAVPKIGPIRSARHDFVEIAEGFDMFFMHWGGSPQAYSAIRNRGVNDLDGMVYSGKYFYRDKTRLNNGIALEHTAYTNGEYMAKGIEAKGWRTQLNSGKAEPFKFVAESTPPRVPGEGTAAEVNFRFSSSFKYSFKYDSASGLYAQSLNGTPFIQEEGKKPREVTNVILLYINIRNIAGDKKGRVSIDLSGGAGLYLSAGGWESITWKKGQPNDPLTLLDKDGKELELNRGKGYIGMVPVGQKGNTKITEAAASIES